MGGSPKIKGCLNSDNIATPIMDYNNSVKEAAFFNFDARCQELNKQYFVMTPITEDEARLSGVSYWPGMFQLLPPPIPNNPIEAFDLLKNLFAEQQFELQKNLFFDTYQSLQNSVAIEEELTILDTFIKNAEVIKYSEACDDKLLNNPYMEYKRIIGGFYNDNLLDWRQWNMNSICASVYGRYVIFYNYLKGLVPKPFNIPQQFNNSFDTSSPPKYCLTNGAITDLYELLHETPNISDRAIINISLQDFLSCFDINNKPVVKPEYLPTGKKKMVFVISKIENLKKRNLIAKDNFDLPAYASTMTPINVDPNEEMGIVFCSKVSRIVKAGVKNDLY